MKIIINFTIYGEGHSSAVVAIAEAAFKAAERAAGEPIADWNLTFGARSPKEMARALARRRKQKETTK